MAIRKKKAKANKKKKIVQAGPGSPPALITGLMAALPLFICFTIRDTLNQTYEVSLHLPHSLQRYYFKV